MVHELQLKKGKDKVKLKDKEQTITLFRIIKTNEKLISLKYIKIC